MADVAYDLDLFENHGRERAPRVRAVKGNKAPRKERFQRIRTVGMAAVLIVLLLALLCGQARMTELTGDIQAAQRDLVNAESDYTYLTGVMDSITSQKNVEQIATSQLGLMKLDKSQITYFTLENEETIRRPESTAKQIAEFLSTGLLSLADYLNP